MTDTTPLNGYAIAADVDALLSKTIARWPIGGINRRAYLALIRTVRTTLDIMEQELYGSLGEM